MLSDIVHRSMHMSTDVEISLLIVSYIVDESTVFQLYSFFHLVMRTIVITLAQHIPQRLHDVE